MTCLSDKKTAGSRREYGVLPRISGGVLLVFLALAFSAGCSTMPNPAKRLVNHVSTKAREVRLREKVDNDRFPTAKEAGLD